MKTRDAILAYQELQGDTDTKTLDINVVDPVSAFEIEVECTNGATSNEDNFISDIVTNIQVVDGAEVLTSLNMAQLEALHFYKMYTAPALGVSEWADGVQRHNALLLFGRKLYDPELCLVPTNYRNPQLKVTFNKAAIRAAGATGFASGTNIKLTVIAKVIEEGATPRGFLMSKIVDSFTSASSGDRRVELPLDYSYRMLMLRCWLEGYDVDEIISDVKLTCDADKFVPIDRKLKQLDAWALGEYGLFEIKHDVLRAHNTDVRTIVNKEGNSILFPGGQDDGLICIARWQWSSQLHITLLDHAGSPVGTAKKLHIAERGHAPHATVPIPFGLSDSPDTWLDPRPYGKVELVLTQATADAVVEVVTEQLRM